MVKRVLGALAVAISVMGLVLSSASAAAPEKGFVAGRAVPCSGPMSIPTAEVSLFQGKVLVASRRFRTGSTFRFSLPPGRYLITNNQAYPKVGTLFRIRANRLVHVVMTDDCD
jgi:hypothetical protein